MPPYENVSCRICDIPPCDLCDECKNGICNHPDCSMMISTFNNNKNKIETYNVCDDCVTNISSKLQEVEITDYEEMIYVKNILHMSKK
jgi:hypothetical protein